MAGDFAASSTHFAVFTYRGEHGAEPPILIYFSVSPTPEPALSFFSAPGFSVSQPHFAVTSEASSQSP